MRCPFPETKIFTPNGKIFMREHVVNDTGYSEVKQIDQCAVLPDCKNYDIGERLKAGVPLEQVDCKLLNPKGTVKITAESKPINKDGD